ncbi:MULTISPECIES: dihydroxyacetone kinase phosphoryl donor subunit DhaM [Carnobacterium]|jgi:dihydroxyacetone kinase phosphotransfer subunit|uniref:phosphoenolpyruvate--glycerone phosphotransferase n=2 Tax=Carnobacterium maltaromaticum TaxID=2751 RepID=K8E7V3_CARML|nr:MULTISPECIES: dihydroxyacetone kinase phosphoryl donor subunit DhaM [Carnobacterium]AOA03470.1 PTS-dependent dihydroxyacetone kinase phosphotransferase subunit DhaM [Carnobacterium maltaromaticum]MBC9787840.1 PTS-dependent dihydroxyacetone kinase phosphotransferase subunit DhaM [Carnobacterium maltaromaticum]MBQ6484232.1 PTS-dependent dihydroxyacetone kinase phosphotransferase subunit DhaM [Carnobacterium sp.]MCC4313285.1 PTS mannnose family transporter subunit IIA [Carnobacterium maltaromat
MSKLGVVVVSHVPAIAEGVVTLMKEVAKDVSITFAGGTDDNEVGTSFAKIEAAFEENTGETLLAFYDLGSAKMNLEMVMELTDKEVHLYDTAFIESSYTAAALIQAGAELDAIEEQLAPMKVK